MESDRRSQIQKQTIIFSYINNRGGTYHEKNI